MKRAGLLLCLLVLACGGSLAPDGPFVSPIVYRIDLPFIPGGATQPWSPPGKGARYWDCPGSLDFGAQWTYRTPGQAPLSGMENILYLNSIVSVENALALESAPDVVMAYNEFDMIGISVKQAVPPLVALLNKFPSLQVVGPCAAFGPEYMIAFMAEFERVAGYPLPIRASCVHCYNTASACADKIDTFLALGYPVWVTEFNMPAGGVYSADDVINHNGCLTRWMDYNVDRFAFWACGIPLWAGEPCVTWLDAAWQDGAGTWRFTTVGQAYAAEPPSWKACGEGGFLRWDQVPPEYRPTPSPTPTFWWLTRWPPRMEKTPEP